MADAGRGVLERFDVDLWAAEAASSPRAHWLRIARPEQTPPPGDWLTWLILAGRGWGKTRTGAEYVADLARTHPGARIALVAATFADGRDTMVEGESGLLEVLDDAELAGGSRDNGWNRSMGELFLANGSRFKIYSSERPRQLRGPQHHFAWADEAAAWLDAHKGTARDTTWSNLQMGLRLPAREGWPADYRTRAIVTTTPRPVALLKIPDAVLAAEPHKAGIIQKTSTVVTRGRTHDNLANLSESFKAEVIDPLAGTSLARQELDGEILEDTDGALLSRAEVEACHVRSGDAWQVLEASTRIVSVDPATTSGENSDETGISVVARGYDGNIYVLGDHSGKGSPEQWALATWTAVHHHRAVAVVIEDNQGGDMCENVLRTAWAEFVRLYSAAVRGSGRGMIEALLDQQGIKSEPGAAARARVRFPSAQPPPILRVHPSGANSGKWIRAQAAKILYEQGRVKHVVPDGDPTHFMLLEDQLTTWTGARGEKSPDRIDALVHGINYLLHPGERSAYRGPVMPRTRAAWLYR